ncbi:MAG: N-formylglutamate amidohydrolase, partial [Acetobacteraceae bacterium]
MRPAVTTLNPDGASRYVLLCEHASNFMPEAYAGLGLLPAELQRHIAWDPGAEPLARLLSAALDAP